MLSGNCYSWWSFRCEPQQRSRGHRSQCTRSSMKMDTKLDKYRSGIILDRWGPNHSLIIPPGFSNIFGHNHNHPGQINLPSSIYSQIVNSNIFDCVLEAFITSAPSYLMYGKTGKDWRSGAEERSEVPSTFRTCEYFSPFLRDSLLSRYMNSMNRKRIGKRPIKN